MPRGPVVAVVGPTAAGKSDLGIELALALGGEVVNADSMQLYRGMDIGTAKVRLDERRGVPHHLLDVWDVTHAADVASFQLDARRVIDALLAAGRVPVLVGGSGLYVRAALDDLSFPGTDPVVRARWEAELTRRGSGELHAELARRAPRAAEAILPSNGRRIVRALEVVELTGDYAATLPEQRAVYDVVQIGVDRDDLDERITQRVDRMWNAGFPDEVRQLVEGGLREGRTASRALGYAQLLAWMDGAMESTDQAKLATISATRRFARRQRSWFRRDNRISWLNQPDVTQALRLVVRSDG
ncbi:tRNA (adenosine(37)-N6)-dimethylallyltransferase MiaA [Frankia sp. AgPm24]|uniref:tRNA (adenosine(37)-N6)-dimethylallyltransferase MiaA n=1 Tax=Frankia sp. AgPm24 TaxID=631128 RepID=UPI00200D8E3F|nr:tRNA (adenosine(37)-N6)-dimethylallyltransferase MiaA [Frankia sp. AgPm24]